MTRIIVARIRVTRISVVRIRVTRISVARIRVTRISDCCGCSVTVFVEMVGLQTFNQSPVFNGLFVKQNL